MSSNIYKKLLEVSKEIDPISKDSTNPFFKSKYFDVNSLIKAVNPILHKHGLVLLQPIQNNEVYSIIIDSESEQTVESSISMPNIQDPQKLGSAITYFRRYTLQSLLGMQAEDDDANLASKPPKPKKDKLTYEGFEYLKSKGTKEQLNQALEFRDVTPEQKQALQLLIDKFD